MSTIASRKVIYKAWSPEWFSFIKTTQIAKYRYKVRLNKVQAE